MVSTKGTETGGGKTIETSDSAVLTLLRGLPDPPTADDRWSRSLNGDKSTSTIFTVDDLTFRQALALAGDTSWEAGKPDGYSTAQQRWEREPHPENDPNPAHANIFRASPTGAAREVKQEIR